MSSTERDITAAARGGFLVPLAWCAGLAAVIAMLRYAGAVDWSSAYAWMYLLAMVALTLNGAVGWLMAGPAELWTSPRRVIQ